MNDSTNNPTEFDRGFAEAERQLRPEIEQLTSGLDYANKSQDTWFKAHARLVALIDDTEEYLKEQHAGTMDEETRELIIEVLRRLGRETTKTIDVEVTMTWKGTAEVPLDFDEYTDDIEAASNWHEPELLIDGESLYTDISIDESDVRIS